MSQATDKEREIHALVVAKNDLAFARLCDDYYEAVFKKVSAYNSTIYRLHDTLIADVVTDSFLNYFNHPTRYNPDKQGLEYFLVMDAEGDLKNALQKIKRHEKKFPKAVELSEKGGNNLTEEDLTPLEQLVNKESAAQLEQLLDDAFETGTDIAMAQLMLAGERRNEEYARLLKIGHLPLEAQRQEVKKQKDRIDKIIRRKIRTGNNDG